MNLEELDKLNSLYKNYDWFHSVTQDNQGRFVIYTKWMTQDILKQIPETILNKQVLVHFADMNRSYKEELDNKDRNFEFQIKSLINDLGKNIVECLFYEIHDSDDAVTNFSNKYPFARELMNDLYDNYGFDVIYDYLENR